jgi:hypothetical protein
MHKIEIACWDILRSALDRDMAFIGAELYDILQTEFVAKNGRAWINVRIKDHRSFSCFR